MTEKDENEQTAVDQETKEEPKKEASAESGTAQDDGLDAILKEFDERKAASSPQVAETKSEPTKPITDISSVDVTALATLEAQVKQLADQRQRDELEKLFDRMTDGVQADSVDAESFLNAMARRDPRLNEAYKNRKDNPKAWGKVETTLKQEFTKRFGKKVDKQATESRDAVAAAVRSASTAAPAQDLTDKDISKMSKEDFDALQRQYGVIPV